MKFFLNYFTPYFEQLKGPTSTLYDLLRASHDPNSPPLTHEAIKKILLQAFHQQTNPPLSSTVQYWTALPEPQLSQQGT